MLLGQSLVVGSVPTPEDLARDDDALSTPAQPFDRIPHDRLGVAVSVGLRIIEEVHASVMSSGHTLDCNLLSDLPAIGDPGAQREFAQFESRTPQLTIVQCSTSPFRWEISGY